MAFSPQKKKQKKLDDGTSKKILAVLEAKEPQEIGPEEILKCITLAMEYAPHLVKKLKGILF